ncbi:hypothetical protein N8878_08190, partial [Psychromonas sp.]|nr:hypothetical protein [Psychromonas sp.]
MPRLFGTIAHRLIVALMLASLAACGGGGGNKDSDQVQDELTDTVDNVGEGSDNNDEGSDNTDTEQNVLEYFVATTGNDSSNDGSETQPFLTLAKAQEMLRSHPNKGEL